MAHFAEIDENNIVKRVIVISDEFDDNEALGESFCQSLMNTSTRWIKTSYNGNIRYNYAGVGMFYDEVNDAFIPVKPFNSWVLNEQFKWVAPISQSDPYTVWNEDIIGWVRLE